MASLKDIKYKVGAIRKTKQITRAMNMVSTAKLRSAQRNSERFSLYKEGYQELLGEIIYRTPEYQHPLCNQNIQSPAVGVIFITPDRGLCGAFTGELVKRFHSFCDSQMKKGIAVHCYCLGRKGYEVVKKTNCSIVGYDIGIISSITFEKIHEISDIMQSLFTQGNIQALYLIHGHFISLLSQESTEQCALPISIDRENVSEQSDVLYEPSGVELLNEILPKMTTISVYNAVLDTIVSEHAARMIAMNNATKNCDDLIASFSRLYNKVRQATVTKELMDIVSGAEALHS
ncbi:MAG: ATP synthase F1 subunit gamma [Desulfovibrionaceae bacterium]|nr:ATP synthase F1 subunit gamma [Desulfovibrionaceae bacterium]